MLVRHHVPQKGRSGVRTSKITPSHAVTNDVSFSSAESFSPPEVARYHPSQPPATPQQPRATVSSAAKVRKRLVVQSTPQRTLNSAIVPVTQSTSERTSKSASISRTNVSSAAKVRKRPIAQSAPQRTLNSAIVPVTQSTSERTSKSASISRISPQQPRTTVTAVSRTPHYLLGESDTSEKLQRLKDVTSQLSNVQHKDMPKLKRTHDQLKRNAVKATRLQKQLEAIEQTTQQQGRLLSRQIQSMLDRVELQPLQATFNDKPVGKTRIRAAPRSPRKKIYRAYHDAFSDLVRQRRDMDASVSVAPPSNGGRVVNERTVDDPEVHNIRNRVKARLSALKHAPKRREHHMSVTRGSHTSSSSTRANKPRTQFVSAIPTRDSAHVPPPPKSSTAPPVFFVSMYTKDTAPSSASPWEHLPYESSVVHPQSSAPPPSAGVQSQISAPPPLSSSPSAPAPTVQPQISAPPPLSSSPSPPAPTVQPQISAPPPLSSSPSAPAPTVQPEISAPPLLSSSPPTAQSPTVQPQISAPPPLSSSPPSYEKVVDFSQLPSRKVESAAHMQERRDMMDIPSLEEMRAITQSFKEEEDHEVNRIHVSAHALAPSELVSLLVALKRGPLSSVTRPSPPTTPPPVDSEMSFFSKSAVPPPRLAETVRPSRPMTPPPVEREMSKSPRKLAETVRTSRPTTPPPVKREMSKSPPKPSTNGASSPSHGDGTLVVSERRIARRRARSASTALVTRPSRPTTPPPVKRKMSKSPPKLAETLRPSSASDGDGGRVTSMGRRGRRRARSASTGLVTRPSRPKTPLTIEVDDESSARKSESSFLASPSPRHHRRAHVRAKKTRTRYVRTHGSRYSGVELWRRAKERVLKRVKNIRRRRLIGLWRVAKWRIIDRLRDMRRRRRIGLWRVAKWRIIECVRDVYRRRQIGLWRVAKWRVIEHLNDVHDQRRSELAREWRMKKSLRDVRRRWQIGLWRVAKQCVMKRVKNVLRRRRIGLWRVAKWRIVERIENVHRRRQIGLWRLAKWHVIRCVRDVVRRRQIGLWKAAKVLVMKSVRPVLYRRRIGLWRVAKQCIIQCVKDMRRRWQIGLWRVAKQCIMKCVKDMRRRRQVGLWRVAKECIMKCVNDVHRRRRIGLWRVAKRCIMKCVDDVWRRRQIGLWNLCKWLILRQVHAVQRRRRIGLWRCAKILVFREVARQRQMERLLGERMESEQFYRDEDSIYQIQRLQHEVDRLKARLGLEGMVLDDGEVWAEWDRQRPNRPLYGRTPGVQYWKDHLKRVHMLGGVMGLSSSDDDDFDDDDDDEYEDSSSDELIGREYDDDDGSFSCKGDDDDDGEDVEIFKDQHQSIWQNDVDDVRPPPEKRRRRRRMGDSERFITSFAKISKQPRNNNEEENNSDSLSDGEVRTINEGQVVVTVGGFNYDEDERVALDSRKRRITDDEYYYSTHQAKRRVSRAPYGYNSPPSYRYLKPSSQARAQHRFRYTLSARMRLKVFAWLKRARARISSLRSRWSARRRLNHRMKFSSSPTHQRQRVLPTTTRRNPSSHNSARQRMSTSPRSRHWQSKSPSSSVRVAQRNPRVPSPTAAQQRRKFRRGYQHRTTQYQHRTTQPGISSWIAGRLRAWLKNARRLLQLRRSQYASPPSSSRRHRHRRISSVTITPPMSSSPPPDVSLYGRRNITHITVDEDLSDGEIAIY